MYYYVRTCICDNGKLGYIFAKTHVKPVIGRQYDVKNRPIWTFLITYNQYKSIEQLSKDLEPDIFDGFRVQLADSLNLIDENGSFYPMRGALYPNRHQRKHWQAVTSYGERYGLAVVHTV